MSFRPLSRVLISILILFSFVDPRARCCDPSPAFQLPEYIPGCAELLEAFSGIEAALTNIVSSGTFNTSSFSVEVTSSKETLWSLYHTARERKENRPGTDKVNGSSVYRIASITKVFTVLGLLQQHSAGKLHLDDTIDKYITELKEDQNGSISWKDITLRALASQLSGIPNDFAQSDLITELPDPISIGLPPATKRGLPSCDSYDDYKTPCSRKDLLDSVRAFSPLYAPNQKSTYCNIAFELLGIVLENVMGQQFAECITTTILSPLGLSSTSITKPNDSVAVIPKGGDYWDIDEGVQNPTGGLYSTSNDLSVFLQYVLTHYNGLTPTLNWFQPASFATGMQSFYGMPWEIFRTAAILNHTNRPVTFVTKGGGLPGYFSNIIMLPEYDLGVTILVAGKSALLSKVREAVSVPLVHAAEAVAQRNLKEKYAGTYRASESEMGALNSSIALAQSPHSGLYVEQWISNGTDLIAIFGAQLENTGAIEQGQGWRAQLIPTLLFREEEKKAGEIWRIDLVQEKKIGGNEDVFSDICFTHVDNLRYAGVPLNEVVFWDGSDEKEKGKEHGFHEIELSAFRVRLQRQRDYSADDLDGTAAGLVEQI